MRTALSALLCLCALAACRIEGKSPTHPEGEPHPEAKAPAKESKAPAALAVAAPVTADPRASHADALAWIAAHQSAEGNWNSDDKAQLNSIGLTGLALLALQSDGSTMSSGAHAHAIARGVSWLMTQQDAEMGLIGKRVGHSWAYDHAIATQALCAALKASPSEQLSAVAQNAVHMVARMRNPYGAWRYDYPPTGENDTSVTGWMVEAIASARAAGLVIDEQAFVGATQWVDDVTDPTTARVGYDTIGSASSRVTGLNDQFPTEHHEAMTASGMLTRLNAGQTADAQPVLKKHEDLLLKKLPEWDPSDKMVDEYYWYFGSLATRRLSGPGWDAWRTAGQTALLKGQVRDGENKGSWDPVGPWGYSGGRVYATTLNALSLSTML